MSKMNLGVFPRKTLHLPKRVLIQSGEEWYLPGSGSSKPTHGLSFIIPTQRTVAIPWYVREFTSTAAPARKLSKLIVLELTYEQWYAVVAKSTEGETGAQTNTNAPIRLRCPFPCWVANCLCRLWNLVEDCLICLRNSIVQRKLSIIEDSKPSWSVWEWGPGSWGGW